MSSANAAGALAQSPTHEVGTRRMFPKVMINVDDSSERNRIQDADVEALMALFLANMLSEID